MLDTKINVSIDEIVSHVFSLADSDEPAVVISEKSLDLSTAILNEMGGVHCFLDDYYLVGIKKTLATFSEGAASELDKAVAFFFKNKTLLLEVIDSYANESHKGNLAKALAQIMLVKKYSKKEAQEVMSCLAGEDTGSDDLNNLSGERRTLILGLVYFIYNHISFNVNFKKTQKEMSQRPIEIFGVMHTQEEFEALRVDLAS